MTTELTKAAQQAHTPEHIAGVDHAHELLRRMGYHRDGDWFIHVNRRGAEAIHISTISTIVNAGQMTLTQRPAAQTEQATPEPVGEPVARVELMQAGGNAGLATRIVEIDDPMRERLSPGDVLYTRPATGVPEGFALVPLKATPKVAMVLYEGARNCFSPKVAEGLWQDALAAAQAKGGE